MKNSLLIRNGRIINPANSMDVISDLLILDGKIKKIEKNIINDKNIEEIDASGYIVSPGLIDIHVHFRDPGFTHKEDILSGAKAAAAGGYTSVILMANTNPKIDSVDSLKYVQEKAKSACINVFQEAALTYDFKEELVDMKTLFENGAAGFTNDGVPVMNTSLLRDAMLEAKKLGAIIALHEEDNKLISCHGINDGKVSEAMGLAGAPRVSEDVMVARDCMLALETGATIDIQHISSKNSVEIIKQIKLMGGNIIAEVTPHHFTLTEDAILEHGTLAKMNPPLRTESDRQGIIHGLKENTIEIIATDHAPHADYEKNVEFKKAPSGIIGLETALALTISELVKKDHLTIMEALEKLTINPSKYYKLNRGDISEGNIADICIFNPDEKFQVKNFKSKSSNSPFVGKELYGKVKYTICSGKLVYSD
ncbi:dihydroorotase [Peptostreptococcus russellii]|uniref:dihydroorotase n=1 Tax=Peptostreptococcus russellii TaxID=215200 RepID=UPI0026E9DE12|nr:dihydroorotase [Peptostreptococcus russellii]